jgi:hypothetical protein
MYSLTCNLILQRILYFADSINYSEWALYISGMITVCHTLFLNTINQMAWQCGAIAIFLAWFNLLIHLQRYVEYS